MTLHTPLCLFLASVSSISFSSSTLTLSKALQQADALKAMEELDLLRADKEKIDYKNVQRIFGFKRVKVEDGLSFARLAF